jgi:hypothetical protein
MPRISQENKQYYKSRIQSVLAQSLRITPTANQVMGIVGAVSWRWDIRNGTFQYYYLFVIGSENVSFPKPVGFALWTAAIA